MRQDWAGRCPNAAEPWRVLMGQTCAEKDFARRSIAWLLWGVPAAVVVLGSFVTPVPRMLLWTPAFLIGGIACVMNAARCGRVHCYITGPLYLLAALATVLAGTDLVPLRWSWIGCAVIGGTVVAYVPEWIRGKYVVPTVARSRAQAS